MPTFTLNNGKIYECPFCGLASVGILYVDVFGVSLREALEIFSDPNNTKSMVYRGGEECVTYEGYTTIIGVEYAYNNTSAVRVALRRPYVGEEV